MCHNPIHIKKQNISPRGTIVFCQYLSEQKSLKRVFFICPISSMHSIQRLIPLASETLLVKVTKNYPPPPPQQPVHSSWSISVTSGTFYPFDFLPTLLVTALRFTGFYSTKPLSLVLKRSRPLLSFFLLFHSCKLFYSFYGFGYQILRLLLSDFISIPYFSFNFCCTLPS